jgi:hypothetical protein
MDPETLNFWANVAAIYLFINLFVVTVAIGVALGFGWWYLRKGRLALALPLLYAQVYALRIQHTTGKVGDTLAAIPIGIHARVAQVQTTVTVLVKGRDQTVTPDTGTGIGDGI